MHIMETYVRLYVCMHVCMYVCVCVVCNIPLLKFTCREPPTTLI